MYCANLVLNGKVVGKRVYIRDKYYQDDSVGIFDLGLDYCYRFIEVATRLGEDVCNSNKDIQCYVQDGYIDTEVDSDKVVWGISSEAVFKYAINRYIYPAYILSTRELRAIAFNRLYYYKDILEKRFHKEVQIIDNVGIKNAFSTWGTCQNMGTRSRFEFAEVLLACGSTKGIDTVIFHELLHACDGGCNDHTGRWKDNANELGSKVPFMISRTTPSTYIKFSPILLDKMGCCMCICENCGSTYVAKKTSKKVTSIKNYRCGKCDGRFRVFKLDYAVPFIG